MAVDWTPIFENLKEELKKLRERNGKCDMERLTTSINGNVCYRNTICTLEDVLEKLYELENKQEQGLLIELPCKVGDVVYVIQSNGKIAKREADMMFLGVLWDEYGKTWFTSEEEAEQTLAKMKGE